MGLLSGVNFMLHACGWLEGGLVASFEKFVMDADQLGCCTIWPGASTSARTARGMDAIREVGPGGHYLGCAHTQANYKTAFWRSELLDYKPFETWDEEGAPRHQGARRPARSSGCLTSYRAPDLDPATAEALADYVARRKPKAC